MSSVADKNDIEEPCEKRSSCRTYLLTYSQADLQKYLDNQAFSELNGSKCIQKVQQN